MSATQQGKSGREVFRTPGPNPFGGFRKKTFRLGEALGQLAALAPRLSDMYAIWVRKRLEPLFREEIMVAVARENACRFCNFVHGQWALAQGLSEEELARIGDGPSARGTAPADRELAFSYAQALSAGGFAAVAPELESEMTRRFGWPATRDVETVARVMTLANLSANTVDALVFRFRGKPAAASRLADELVIGAAFALVYPLMILVLAFLRRRSPLALLRDFARAADTDKEEA